jgi:hypothetical protein
MRSKRPFLGAAVVAAIASASWLVAVPSASSTPDLAKVTICHRTASFSNPYVRITVAESAVDGDTTNDNGQGDHTTHTGPVFDGVHKGWGDIIPPFDENGDPRPSGTPTLNWPAGEDIFNNGCDPITPVAVGHVAVHKVVVNPDDVTVPSAFDIELVCTTDSGANNVLDEQLSLAGGATSDLFEVPAGASCDATETTDGIANLVSAVGDGPVTIATDTDSTVTVTNTFAATPTPPPGPEVGPVVSPEVQVSPAEATVQAPVAAPVQVTPRTTG